MTQYTDDWEFLVLGENPGQDVLKSLRKELNRRQLKNEVIGSTSSKPTLSESPACAKGDVRLLLEVSNSRGACLVFVSMSDP